jgi:hypothetical protein
MSIFGSTHSLSSKTIQKKWLARLHKCCSFTAMLYSLLQRPPPNRYLQGSCMAATSKFEGPKFSSYGLVAPWKQYVWYGILYGDVENHLDERVWPYRRGSWPHIYLNMGLGSCNLLVRLPPTSPGTMTGVIKSRLLLGNIGPRPTSPRLSRVVIRSIRTGTT